VARRDLGSYTVGVPAGYEVDGYEAMGALRFAPVTLGPGRSRARTCSFWPSLADDGDVAATDDALEALVRATAARERIADWLDRTRDAWQARGAVAFRGAPTPFRPVAEVGAVQPYLRRLFGNSFLPYHDYGRGGRGWRDLWQDCLALLMLEPEPVRDLLFSSFAGVRIDGSNATIIGSRPGEFLADRNNIPRVWMDHGAWPYLTTRLYIDRQRRPWHSCCEEQTYFKDRTSAAAGPR
jgi:cellobiose phosphorylase